MPRLSGWLLVAGALVFWAGAVTPPYRQWMGVSLIEYLNIVGAHRLNWFIMHGLFATGTVLTLAGLSSLTAQLGSRGDSGWSMLAMGLFAVGSTLWLVSIGHRVSVTPWAALELARTGQVPAAYEVSHRLMGLLFAAFMLLSYLAMAGYGMALLRAATLPAWVGWTAVVFGLLGVPGLVTPVFQPPLMVFMVPFVIGVAILRS